MLKEKEILDTLDNIKQQGYYCHFLDLDDAYSYLIECRLNVFKGSKDRWAIATERLGYNPRADRIVLDISYFGNCLINLEHYNGQDTNWYRVIQIDDDSYYETIDGESLKLDANYWLVKDKHVFLSHDKQEYIEAGIELNEWQYQNEIRIEEAARLIITKYPNVFRATDEQLYKSIPKDLKKILVLDEWYHRDFNEFFPPKISDEHLKFTYEQNKNSENLSFDEFSKLFREGEQRQDEHNQKQWQDNRPSSYETWQQIAKVIVTGETSYYKPTLNPNTHWTFYPESGNL